MVYIHGGNFYAGDAKSYPPHYLLEKDIVYVAIQYRLGPLGFLSTNSIDIPGNAGFRDVILALKWIQKYIQNFGGDPAKVTIFGHSAGGVIVSALVLSPYVNENLFQRAIIQSGAYFGGWVFDYDPIETASKLKGYTDCNNQLTLEECFMQMNVKHILKAFQMNNVGDFMSLFLFSVVLKIII